MCVLPAAACTALLCLCCLLGCGCVRAGFEAPTRSTADAAVSDDAHPPQDAQPQFDAPGADSDAQGDGGAAVGWTVDPQALIKRSVNAPLLGAPAPTSQSCGRYLIALPPSWVPTTFVDSGEIVLSIPCKYNDSGTGGWHTAFARWDGAAAAATWVDGDLTAPGNQETLNKHDLVKGQELHNQASIYYERLADGRLVGIGRRYNAVAKAYQQVPIVAPSVAALAASHWRVDLPNVFDFGANDGSWKGAAELPRALLYDNSVFYIYNQTRDAPKDTTSYLSVSTSADMLGAAAPSGYLAAGYRHPYVFKHRGAFHLVAYSESAQQWQHIRGASPTSFAFGAARDLKLERFIGGTGGWDSPLFVHYGSDQPLVNGVEVLGDTLYLFYLAGDLGYPGNPPYKAQRGIGVLSAPLVKPL